MQKSRPYYLSAGVLILIFIIFSLIVRQQLLNNFDYGTTLWLQAHISNDWDTFFSIFSVLGTVEATSVVLLVIILVNRNRNSWYIIISYGIILLIELFGKYFIPHPGPPNDLARYKVFFAYPSSYLLSPPSSYPSGHAGRTLLLSGALFFFSMRSTRFSKATKWIFIALIVIYDCILLVSRVDLGEHWASDVIGGTLLGLAFALINGGLLLKHTSKPRKQH